MVTHNQPTVHKKSHEKHFLKLKSIQIHFFVVFCFICVTYFFTFFSIFFKDIMCLILFIFCLPYYYCNFSVHIWFDKLFIALFFRNKGHYFVLLAGFLDFVWWYCFLSGCMVFIWLIKYQTIIIRRRIDRDEEEDTEYYRHQTNGNILSSQP